MKTPKIVNMVELSRERADEIRTMTAGIEGHGEAPMWTMRMRPVLRGGKAWIGPMVVEDHDE